jgi:putative DNA primase/helicase
LFRYASEDTFINLRAFHDLKDGAPPLFVEPVQIGAASFIERVCERIHEAAAHPEPHVFCPPVCSFTEPNGAATENLAEGVALSVESDSNASAALKKLTSILGKPTAVVASGGMSKNEAGRLEAKLHLHWRLAEPTRDAADHERLREARALAAELVGADKSATSIVHPLRWPGSWHRKTQMPRLVTLKVNPGAEIELGEALERLREACPVKPPPAGNGHDRDEEGRDLKAALPELEAAMGVIPNNATWDEWNRIGMALWVASGGQGFDAFDAWSKKHPKYDERNTKLRWSHYYRSPPDRIGAGTIFHLASQADADWRGKIKAPEAPDWQKKAVEDSDKALAEQERAEAEKRRIDELARKSRMEYDRARKAAAAELKVRTETLDEEVRERREEIEIEDQPLLHPWWEVEPWEQPVETAALLIELQEQILKYIVMSKEQALVIALWITMAWVHSRSVVHSPYLMVTSPQRDSGKSTLLGVLGFLIPRSLLCVGLNEAVLFRSIDYWTPCLITDEADTVFADNEPLRAVYNSGWTRGTGVPRCIGDNHVPKLFATFCPKVLGLKGKNLPDTTASRCIIIELKRKLPSEEAQDFAHVDDDALATLRRKLARWGDDNWEGLAKAQPQIPAGFDNRIRRNWWVLLAAAELAGADCAERARKAATAMEGVQDLTDTEIELLRDIKAVFDADGSAEISTKALITALSADEERPWATFAKGKPVTDRQIARMLGKYRIKSDDVRPNGVHAKGYQRVRFEDVWARYLPKPFPPAAQGGF